MTKKRKGKVLMRWGVVWEDGTFDPEYATYEDAQDALYYAKYKRNPMLSGRVCQVKVEEIIAPKARGGRRETGTTH